MELKRTKMPSAGAAGKMDGRVLSDYQKIRFIYYNLPTVYRLSMNDETSKQYKL